MSINEITFLHGTLPTSISNSMFNSSISNIRFYFNDYSEVKQFLNKLDSDKIYVLSLELVLSWPLYIEDDPVIVLSKPFLVTRNSNYKLISEYIQSRISIACNLYSIEDMNEDNIIDPGVLVKYREITYF
jgi:hypothetical protein